MRVDTLLAAVVVSSGVAGEENRVDNMRSPKSHAMIALHGDAMRTPGRIYDGKLRLFARRRARSRRQTTYNYNNNAYYDPWADSTTSSTQYNNNAGSWYDTTYYTGNNNAADPYYDPYYDPFYDPYDTTSSWNSNAWNSGGSSDGWYNSGTDYYNTNGGSTGTDYWNTNGGSTGTDYWGTPGSDNNNPNFNPAGPSQNVEQDEEKRPDGSGMSVGGGNGVHSGSNSGANGQAVSSGNSAFGAAAGPVSGGFDSTGATTQQIDVNADVGAQAGTQAMNSATALLDTYMINFPDAVLASGHSCSEAKHLVAPCNTTMTVSDDMIITSNNDTIYQAQAKSKCPHGCKLTITFEGDLILYANEPQGSGKTEVWNGGNYGGGAYGVLFPDGNFLVMNVNHRIKFKSMNDSPAFNDACAAEVPAITSRSLDALNF